MRCFYADYGRFFASGGTFHTKDTKGTEELQIADLRFSIAEF